MIRLYAVAEGRTEEIFLSRVLAPHLMNRSVILQPMQVLRGRGARGGGSSWQPWQQHLKRLLAEHKGQDVRFTTMLDLYGIPKDTPGWTMPGSRTGYARADAILEGVSERLTDWRLIPYVQVYEFETLIFADLKVLARQAADILDAPAFAELEASVLSLEPEVVNDDPKSAPSKRIMACVPGFRKATRGVEIASAIGLPLLRERCPRFGSWVTTLEGLAEG